MSWLGFEDDVRSYRSSHSPMYEPGDFILDPNLRYSSEGGVAARPGRIFYDNDHHHHLLGVVEIKTKVVLCTDTTNLRLHVSKQREVRHLDHVCMIKRGSYAGTEGIWLCLQQSATRDIIQHYSSIVRTSWKPHMKIFMIHRRHPHHHQHRQFPKVPLKIKTIAMTPPRHAPLVVSEDLNFAVPILH